MKQYPARFRRVQDLSTHAFLRRLETASECFLKFHRGRQLPHAPSKFPQTSYSPTVQPYYNTYLALLKHYSLAWGLELKVRSLHFSAYILLTAYSCSQEECQNSTTLSYFAAIIVVTILYTTTIRVRMAASGGLRPCGYFGLSAHSTPRPRFQNYRPKIQNPTPRLKSAENSHTRTHETLDIHIETCLRPIFRPSCLRGLMHGEPCNSLGPGD